MLSRLARIRSRVRMEPFAAVGVGKFDVRRCKTSSSAQTNKMARVQYPAGFLCKRWSDAKTFSPGAAHCSRVTLRRDGGCRQGPGGTLRAFREGDREHLPPHPTILVPKSDAGVPHIRRPHAVSCFAGAHGTGWIYPG